MKVKIRPATLKDLDTLVHQRHMMFEDMDHPTPEEHEIGDRAYRKWASREMRADRFVGFLATTLSGRVVAGGCVWLQEVQPRPGFSGGRRPYLMSMYTEPKSRGAGLASLIVRQAMDWCKRKGYSRMTLHASKMGRRVYKKIGWQRTWEMAIELPKKPEGSLGARPSR